MLGRLARLGVLAAALVVAAASTTNQGHSPQYPYNAQPQPQPQARAEAVYVCTEVHTPRTDGSFCFPTQARCDQERGDAEKDGARTTDCRPLAPVSCFQLGNDPSPSMEACAISPSDCDLLRLIDRDKNGQTGGPCQWRHGIARGPGAPPPAAR